MRAQPLWPSVEPLWGHGACEGCDRMDPSNHADGTIEALVELLVDHRTCERCAIMGPSNHADAATGAFGGALYGASCVLGPRWVLLLLSFSPQWLRPLGC
eukprot:8026252-Pyramimonas_sp.AAC.1